MGEGLAEVKKRKRASSKLKSNVTDIWSISLGWGSKNIVKEILAKRKMEGAKK